MSELVRIVIEGACPACEFRCSARTRKATVEAARDHERYAHPSGGLSWALNESEYRHTTGVPGGRE